MAAAFSSSVPDFFGEKELTIPERVHQLHKYGNAMTRGEFLVAIHEFMLSDHT